MRFCPIASGSSGNCVYVGAKKSHLLVDAGLSGKRIEEALSQLGIPKLTGVLVTHEHSDHVSGVGVISRRFGVPVFATPHTWRYFLRHGTIGTIAPELQRIVIPGERISVGDIDILPFDISHDASQPVGYCLFTKKHKAVVVTDTGYVTDTMRNLLMNTHVILLECNYDVEMLQNGSYPKMLKERIKGSRGHLSNIAAGALLAEIASNTTNSTDLTILQNTSSMSKSSKMPNELVHVFLGHLSEENNRPMIALDTVQRILEVNGLHIRGLAVAERDFPSEMICL